MSKKQNHTDIITKGWVEYVPARMRPYFYLMRLDRPIGTWLLLLPALWAIVLAGGIHEWKIIALFCIGALVMRGAGCVINDLWDRDLDGRVERTATRPIPSGDASIKGSIVFLLFLLFIGLVVLFNLNYQAIVLGFVSVLFVVTYPLMKRITWWPQAFLGFTFNFGALMGWSAIGGEFPPWQSWCLYVSGIFWTLGYDTIYAMQDRADDALVGVKSSARYLIDRLNQNYKKIIYIFYFIHFLLFFVCVFCSVSIENNLMLGVLSAPALHLIWQVKTLDENDPKNSLKRFQSNRDYGLLMLGVIIILSFL